MRALANGERARKPNGPGRTTSIAGFLALLLGPCVTAQAQADRPPFVTTPGPAVQRMPELADTGPDDVVYDLGAGDGRIVIAAARDFGARGVGVEIDPTLVRLARLNAEQAGVADRVRFIEADLFTVDLSEASVVTLFLRESLNQRLRPRLLRQLAPGTPVVSYRYDMGADWPPLHRERAEDDWIILWRIPDPP